MSKANQTFPAGVPLIRIRPSRGWRSFDLKELWVYRDLLFFLTWRDIIIRYKQAALGVAWAVIQPLITMVVFSVIFGRLAKLPSDGVPYPLFSFAALLPWQLFASAVQNAGTSLVGNANLLTKVYFPRLIIPFSAVGAGLLDFAISLIVLMGLMLYYGIFPTWGILWLLPLVVLALLTALSVGLWLSALNVQYRDVQYMIPFLVQVLLFVSPVAYSANIIPKGIPRVLYSLNPLVGVIEGFRWALLGTKPPDGLAALSVMMVLFLLVTGALYFRRMEKTFADVV